MGFRFPHIACNSVTTTKYNVNTVQVLVWVAQPCPVSTMEMVMCRAMCGQDCTRFSDTWVCMFVTVVLCCRRQHLIYSGVADDLRKGPDWINQAIQLMLSHVVAIPAVLFLL